MVRNRSAFLDGLKARLDEAGREGPVLGGEPRQRGASTSLDGEAWAPGAGEPGGGAAIGAGAPGGGNQAAPTPRSAPASNPWPPWKAPVHAALESTPDHRKGARSWSVGGMPERMRQAIASVRRISIEEAAELDDQEPEPHGLREPPGRFARVDPPEPDAPGEPSRPSLSEMRERSAPRGGSEPSLSEIREASVPRDTSERSVPWETSELAGSWNRSEPPATWDTSEPAAAPDPSEASPPLEASEPPPPLDTPGPPRSLDAPEPAPSLDTPEPLPPLDAPVRRPNWRHSEEEPAPGPGRGIRIAALVMASAVVLLVGSGLGVLLAGWQIELPSLPTGTAASPEPVAESEAPNPAANTSEAPPPITEVTKVERAPMPPAAAVEGLPRAAAAAGMPLPPPPKPAPWSSVAAEGPATTDDAIEDALESLLRETDGSGGPFEPLAEEEVPLAPIRVFVHYSASAAGEEATAMHLARHLEAEGFAVEAREVEFPIDLDSIRYFFPADRDDAEALGASLKGQLPGGATPRVLDFTRYEPKPSPGYLELWIGT